MSYLSRTQRFGSVGEIDRSAFVGLGLSFALLSIAIIASGKLFSFFDWKGCCIVIGGSVGATLTHFSLRDFTRAMRMVRLVFQVAPIAPTQRIRELMRMAQAVRAAGPVCLESEALRTRDRFLRKGLELVADAQPLEDVRRMLETEMRTSNEQATRAVQVFETLGTFAPALGLIGTLVGLIQMLGNLNDPSTVGPSMSIALITTLYGAVLANLVFLPISGKIRVRNEETWLLNSLSLEGLMSLGRQENPLILEQRLKSYLPDRIGR